jgi:U3 small nucleolar RNA-associated protein 12
VTFDFSGNLILSAGVEEVSKISLFFAKQMITYSL